MVVQSQGSRKEFVPNGQNDAVTQNGSSEDLTKESVFEFPNALDSCKTDVRNTERNA